MGESSVLSSHPPKSDFLPLLGMIPHHKKTSSNKSHHIKRKEIPSPHLASKTIHTIMRVSSFFLFAAIATETAGAQGIFRGCNDGNCVRALVEEVSMSADLSLSFSFGGIYGAEIAGIGKAGKSSPTPTNPPTSKPTHSPVIGKAGKTSQKPTSTPTSEN